MTTTPTREETKSNCRKLELVFLTNFIPPYRIKFFKALVTEYPRSKILLSVKMEPDRRWPIEWHGLPIILQSTITVPSRVSHPAGFSRPGFVHLSIDTAFFLFRHDPNIVITSELGARTLQCLVYKLFNRQARLLLWLELSEESERSFGGVRRFVRRAILRWSDAVLINGKSGRRYIASLGFDPKKIHVIPPGSDAQLNESNHLRTVDQQRRLLYVGSLIPRKGLHNFLEALCDWARLNSSIRVEFWIAGEGSLEGSIKSTRTPSNLIVRLLGQVPFKNLSEVYNECGIFVFPTLSDVWGFVVNEAMSHGLPVLGSRLSQAVEEMVSDGTSGWVFDPLEPHSVMAAINKALTVSLSDLNVMRQTALQTSREFNVERMIAETINAIRKIDQS
jgi:glycosyltransferase involved in cell wall biosynthesis